MNSNEDFCSANRREFLKKSLYTAPALVALGYLTPAMVYGVDSVVLPAQAVIVSGETGNPAPGAGSGSGNTGSGVSGSSADGGGGSNGAGVANTPVANADNNETR